MAASEVASFEMNFFRIVDTSKTETSVSGIAYLLKVKTKAWQLKFWGKKLGKKS